VSLASLHEALAPGTRLDILVEADMMSRLEPEPMSTHALQPPRSVATQLLADILAPAVGYSLAAALALSCVIALLCAALG
jgi:hypothetical protein